MRLDITDTSGNVWMGEDLGVTSYGHLKTVDIQVWNTKGSTIENTLEDVRAYLSGNMYYPYVSGSLTSGNWTAITPSAVSGNYFVISAGHISVNDFVPVTLGVYIPQTVSGILTPDKHNIVINWIYRN